MVRNIVTGKNREIGEWEMGKGESAASPGSIVSPLPVILFPHARQRAFTLLELMIVITIIIILAAIVLPQYQKTILTAREAVLREDLYNLRKLLDQYAADKQKLPASIDELVSAGYMRELPQDPMTGQQTWDPVTGEDPNLTDGGQGVVDVHSLSTDVSLEGTSKYNEW